MREILELLEEKKTLELKKLQYPETGLAPVMGQQSIKTHYGKLARGYVDKFNRGEGDSEFNEAGAYLHNIFFSQFKSPKNANIPYGASLGLINKNFGSFTDFKKIIKEEALACQGSCWVYLSRSGQIKIIKNHAIRRDIALLIDMWEHAWINDYGANKAKYLDNIWRIINWEYVNRRIYAGEKA
jgi:superoxide dismutase, Fe-Mn family